MSLFTPTAFYFGQPVAASGYIIRPDTYASSVTIAIPGTQFGSTFGQTSYRSDISGYINGGSSLNPKDAALSGSGQTTNASTNFTGVYSTSMSRGTNSNLGAIPGNSTQVNFGTGDFTIEYFWNSSTQTGESAGLFFYNNGCGFFQMSFSSGYYRYTVQNSSAGETIYDYTFTPSANTWYHVAVCRVGSNWYLCFNGTIRGVSSLSGATGTTAGFGMMGWYGNSNQNTAYFQDFRVTKGVARYTGTAGTTYTIPQSIVTTG